METLIEWQSYEHPHTEKSNDWFWILGIVAAGSAVLAFYFGNILFGIFIIIGSSALGLIAAREPKEVDIKITQRGIVMGKYEYPYVNYRSFWIEDDHMHGARILLHPLGTFLPLLVIPVDDNVDLEHLRDVMNDYLDEEFLRESALHHLFDKLGL
jgi:hypothetical protein